MLNSLSSSGVLPGSAQTPGYKKRAGSREGAPKPEPGTTATLTFLLKELCQIIPVLNGPAGDLAAGERCHVDKDVKSPLPDLNSPARVWPLPAGPCNRVLF